jgi:hypothetical protein
MKLSVPNFIYNRLIDIAEVVCLNAFIPRKIRGIHFCHRIEPRGIVRLEGLDH